MPGGLDNNEDNDFIVKHAIEEKVVCGDFNVGIYMTERNELNKGFRWMSTQMYGSLRLTTRGELEGIPLASIKVTERGSAGSEFESLFEYELPLNFKHDCDLSPTFYAVEGLNGQYFGFQFAKRANKEVFTQQMKKL